MITYNKHNKKRASELRQAGNMSEALLWLQLRNKQFCDLNFRRQKRIGNYIVDFYCPEKKVVIEIDGCSHDRKGEYDFQRERYLESLGLTVIHLSDYDVKKKMQEVMESLWGFFASS